MILVDTSVWVDHFRGGNRRLRKLLVTDSVSCHPFVIGELACGNLRDRREVLGLLDNLPRIAVAEDQEVRDLVERQMLSGKGLGWVDVHLLASVLISRDQLWTLDLRLARVAGDLRIAA